MTEVANTGGTAPAVAAAPVAAPAPSTATDRFTRRSELRAELGRVNASGAPAPVAPPEGNPGPPAPRLPQLPVQQAPGAEWDERLPKQPPKPGVEQRIAQRAKERAEAARAAPLAEQLAQERARNEQRTQAEQRADSEFQELIKQGKVNDALKVRGLSVTFEDLSKSVLQSMGGFEPIDPKYSELHERLSKYEERETQQQERARKAREQAESQRAYQADLESVAAEVAQLESAGLSGASQLAKVPAFPALVLRTLESNPGMTLDQAAAIGRKQYHQLYESLHAAFGGGQPGRAPAPVARPVQAQAPGLPRAAAAPDNTIPADRKERREMLRRAMMQLT